MIKSLNFCIGAIMFSIIPLLIIDIAHHSVDWTKNVHDEVINLAYHSDVFSSDEKKNILDDIFKDNRNLGLQLILKSVLGVVLLGGSIYLMRRYSKERKEHLIKPSLYIAAATIFMLSIKVLVMPRMIFNPNIDIISYDPEKETFESFYNKNFNGKVVYVDFWGTYCGPCLKEFKHYTPKLKQRYSSKKDLAFLYICGGDEMRHKYMWREQIKNYNVEGKHIFLNMKEYSKLYNRLTGDNKDYVMVPWYIMLDSKGKVAIESAAHPGDKSRLYEQIDNALLAVNK